MSKRRIGYALLLFGLLGLMGLELLRANRERDHLRTQYAQQLDSLSGGLRQKWARFLLDALGAHRLEKTFQLRYDRSGRELRSPFFPIFEVSLDWQLYRALPPGATEERRRFLRNALGRARSWDRVLALVEWKKLFPGLPEGKIEFFDLAAVNEEAHQAFARIQELFASNHDFTFVRDEFELESVFFRSTGTGEIEAFVPSIASVAPLLEEFKKSNALVGAVLGPTSLEIRFPGLAPTQGSPAIWADLAFLLLNIFLLGAGLAFLVIGFRQEQKLLSKRVTFLNQVVHELKTPLAGLKLHAQLAIGNGGLPENLAAIDESASRLDRLFDEIVQVNRPFRQAELQTLSSADLRALLEGLSAQISGVELKGGPDCFLMAETGRLRLVLRNLLGNAVKYGNHAEVNWLADSEGVKIRIRDHGPGVSAQDARRIFEEFYRAESARQSSVDGLGIGLSLSSKLAAEMGAEIILENPGEAGASFALRLKGKA